MCKDLGDGFESLCGDASRDDDDAPYCTGSGTNMMMNGFVWVPKGNNPCLVLFFKSWLIDNDLKLALSMIGVFLLGVSNAFANQYRDYVWRLRSDRKEEILSQAIHTSLGALQLSIGYFLMLVAMTYVFIYFAAAVVGLALGQVLVASRNGQTTLNAAQKDSCCGSSVTLRTPSMTGSGKTEKYFTLKNEDDEDEEEGGNIKQVKLEIEGMTCSSCIQTVRRALMAVSGVKSVSIFLGAPKSFATVVVRDDKNDDSMLLVRAVEGVGFDATLV
jgi:copper chaperone CopZ